MNTNVIPSGMSFEIFTTTQSWQYWYLCHVCIPVYLQFSFSPMDVSKCNISNQDVCGDYILRLNILLD